MVMHARKTQRMNDGYFEKHQSQPYQNSKYSSRFERIRDSPNGTYRSDSPDSQSPRDRDRVYQSKSSYSIQKVRDKERENRDYKSSRDKYSDCSRSPKDKRTRDSEYRSNHDRSDDKSVKSSLQNVSTRDRKSVHNSCPEKRDDRERITRVGDWSEHTSSSGKKYYYNCKTEVSQWEKPREWVDRERDRYRSRDRDRDRDYTSNSSRSGHDKHSNSRSSISSGSKDSAASGSSRHWNREENERSSHKYADENSHTMQDMDISPGDSTPTSESHQPPVVTNENLVGPVLLATALPRIVSHPNVQQTVINNRIEVSQPVMVPAPSSIITSNAPGPPLVNMTLCRSLSHISSSTPDSNDKTLVMSRQSSSSDGGSVHLTVETNHNGPMCEGPPTPTHSETPDCTKASVSLESPQSTTLPPLQSVSTSLQSVSSSLQALRPQGPTITPSLANYYKDELVNHVRGWPAEILEKQAEKLAGDANIMSSVQCTKVSAELKSARAIVRLTEIQGMLQEQRILFLRQQIKALEEMKSQNSFMSDDS